MLNSDVLHGQIIAMSHSFFEQGLLHKKFEPFYKSFQDEPKPNFVEEIMFIYFKESAKIMVDVAKILYGPNPEISDLRKLRRSFQQLLQSSGCIGAVNFGTSASKILELWSLGKFEEGRATFLQLRDEHKILLYKLCNYFRLLILLGIPINKHF